MAPAMKAMKATAMKSSGMTQAAVYASVAESANLKPKQVKTVVEGVMGVAAKELKKSGAFKLAGMLNLKLKSKPARAAKKGVNPFTKEPCVFKAKPASKTIRASALSKFKTLVN